MTLDGYVIDDATQGVQKRPKIFVDGFNVYRREKGKLCLIGYVEDGLAYEYLNGNNSRQRCLGPVENFE